MTEEFDSYTEYKNNLDFDFIINKIEPLLTDKAKNLKDKMVHIPFYHDVDTNSFDNFENINFDNIIRFSTTSVKHKFPPIPFAFSRGILALFSNKENSELENSENLGEIFDMEDIDDYNSYSKISFLKLFLIASQIRSWIWYDRGPTYSANIYFDLHTNKIYCSQANELLEEAILTEDEFNRFKKNIKKNYDIEYISNAFNKTAEYPIDILTSEKLLIPVTGMHEALILNENTINGFEYNKISKHQESIIIKYFNEIFQIINTEYTPEKFDSLDMKIESYKNIKISEKISQIENICVKSSKDLWKHYFCKEDGMRRFAIVYFSNSNYFLNNDISNFITNDIICFTRVNDIPAIIYLLINQYKKDSNNDNKLFEIFNEKNISELCRCICMMNKLKLAQLLYNNNIIKFNDIEKYHSDVTKNKYGLDMLRWINSIGKINIHHKGSISFFHAFLTDNIETGIFLWDITDDKDKLIKDFITYDSYYSLPKKDYFLEILNKRKKILDNLKNKNLEKEIDNLINKIINKNSSNIYKIFDETMFSDISYLGEHVETLNKYKDNLSNENLIEIFNHKLLIKLNTSPNYSTLKIDNKLITKESLEISGIFWFENDESKFIYFSKFINDCNPINDIKLCNEKLNTIDTLCKSKHFEFYLSDKLYIVKIIDERLKGHENEKKIRKFLNNNNIKFFEREDDTFILPFIKINNSQDIKL